MELIDKTYAENLLLMHEQNLRAAGKDKEAEGMNTALADISVCCKPIASGILMNWIPCAEQMPEEDQLVIVCYYGSDLIVPDYEHGETLEECMERIRDKASVYFGWFSEDEGWTDCYGGPIVISPEYWMPLPKPPKKEGAS